MSPRKKLSKLNMSWLSNVVKFRTASLSFKSNIIIPKLKLITDLLPSWLCCLWLSSPLEKICMHRTPLSSWPLQGFSSRSTRTKALRRFTLQSCWWHQVWCSATESSGCLFTGILLWLNLRSVISNTCVYLLLHIQKLAYSYFIHTWQQRQISTIFYSLITKHLLETQRFTFGTLSPSLNIIYYLCKSSSNMSVWTKLHVCWAVQTCCLVSIWNYI